jgi:5-formyltetrahydrofolate cyclo-ligase
MSDASAESKKAMRAEMRARVAAIKPFARAQRARRLAATVLRSPALAGARLVLAYRALPDEIDVDEVVRALAARGVRIAFPRVEDDGSLMLLEVAAADPLAASHWRADRFGIAAPNVDSAAVRRVMPREIDAVLVPGRAFDARGARLGRGKGYYDRLLGRLRPDSRRATVGVCFREQVVDCVAESATDRRVAFIAAEGKLLRASHAGRAAQPA